MSLQLFSTPVLTSVLQDSALDKRLFQSIVCSIRLRVSTQDFYHLALTTFKISIASTTATPSLLNTRFLTPCSNLKFLVLQINCFKFPCILACNYEFRAIKIVPNKPHLNIDIVEENHSNPGFIQRNINLTTLPHSPNLPLINIRNRNIKYWSQFITCRPNSDIAVLLQFCIHPNSLGTPLQIFHFSEAVQCSWILHPLPNVVSTPNRTTTNHYWFYHLQALHTH